MNSLRYKHQTKAFERGKKSNCILAHDPGCGKTVVALDLIAYWKEGGEFFGQAPALVVAPLSILEAAWMDDVKKFHPKLKDTPYHHRYPNLLQRDFQAQGPNQKWATDVTFIPTQAGWVYCAVIQDLFDSFIVAPHILRRNTVDRVTTPLRQALAKAKVTAELRLHSDQGHQYCSHAYFVLTQQYAIAPSMSRRGNYLDNAVVENFFGHLKEEAIRRQPLASLEEARLVIDDYIWFYNYERIQLKTKLTPAEVRGQFR